MSTLGISFYKPDCVYLGQIDCRDMNCDKTFQVYPTIAAEKVDRRATLPHQVRAPYDDLNIPSDSLTWRMFLAAVNLPEGHPEQPRTSTGHPEQPRSCTTRWRWVLVARLGEARKLTILVL